MSKKLLLLLLLFVCNISLGQFTSNSALNEVIQDQAGSEQATPLISSRDDGGAYISWFDQSSGSYVLRMQRLDAAGNKLWGPQGIMVSNAPQSTALFRYDLKTDQLGNAVVAFQDERTGSLQIVIQKLDSNGIAFWQTNGIVLLDAVGTEGLSPSLGILGNNRIIIAWNAYSANAKWVSFYDLDPITGAPINGGTSPEKIISGIAGTNYSRPKILGIGLNQYYLLYVQEVGNFPGASSKIYAKKMESGNISLWPNQILVSTKTITFFYFPNFISDGNTGFTIAFNTSNPTGAALTSVYLQHVDSSGLLWSPTGIAATSSTSIQSYLGDYFHHTLNNETWIAIQETNTSQSASGNSFQRVDANGILLLGANGVVVDPQVTSITTPVGFAQNGTHGTIIYFDGSFGQQVIKATNINSTGAKQWTISSTSICSNLSNKDDIGITKFINDQIIVAWSDTRIDKGVYTQNLNMDGTIGPLAVGINSLEKTESNFLFQNPSSDLIIRSNLGKSQNNLLRIYSFAGSILIQEEIISNDQSFLIETNNLAAGIYLVQYGNQIKKWIKCATYK
jgi:hypothetical protein